MFISGTSLKWSIKKYWEENELKNNIKVSKVVDKIQPKKKETTKSQDGDVIASQISSQCDPEQYIDDDLFGYFDTNKRLRRYAPVKTSGMISLFDIGTDIDNLVRYSQKSDNHSLFDKEISTNVFRSNWALELDRIGKTTPKDTSEAKNDVNIKEEDKEKRIKLLLEAIFNLWHRTQQSNYLTNTQPQIMTMFFSRRQVIDSRR